MKQFGCSCYIHIESQFRNKVDERAKECLFLGYVQASKSVIYGDYSSGKFTALKPKNVKFDERRMYASQTAQDEDMEKEQVLILERGQDINTSEAVTDVEIQTHKDTTEEAEPGERRTKTSIQSNSLVDDQIDQRTFKRKDLYQTVGTMIPLMKVSTNNQS